MAYLRKLVLAFVLVSPVMHAMQEMEGVAIVQFDPNDARFRAADKWSTEKAFVVGGTAGAIAGALCVVAGGPQIWNKETFGITAGIVGAITGSITVWQNGNYTTAYDAANGRNMNGAAAANNPHGVQAWLNYGQRAIQQDNDNMTPLMYASANGSLEAAQVISDNMQSEYEVVESVTETESQSVKTERGLDPDTIMDNWLALEKVKTKSKSTKKKRVKTADMQDLSGRTAFHWAFDGDHFKIMLYLLQRGKANGNIEDNRGRSIKNMIINGRSINDVLDEARKRGLVARR